MINQLELGAKVKGQDDKALGTVKYLVANPQDNQMTHLIIETGELAHRQIVVDKKWVVQTTPDGKTVDLSLTEEQLKDMPNFREREYSATDGTYATANTPTVAAVPTGYLYPAINSASVANTMNGQMAFSQGLAEAPANQAYTEKMNVPENSLIIKEGAQVEARDGNVGKVKKVNLNPENGQLDSFLVEKGFFFKDEYVVPMEYVETATDVRVDLNLTKNEMERLS